MHWLCTHILILAYSNFNARPLTSIKLPVLVNKRTDAASLRQATTTGPRVERDHRSTSDDA